MEKIPRRVYRQKLKEQAAQLVVNDGLGVYASNFR